MEMRLIPRKLLFTAAVALAGASVAIAQSQGETVTTLNPPAAPAPVGMMPGGLITLPQDDAFSQYSFVVDKSKRSLYVYQTKGDSIDLVATYPADIGKKSGPKQKENDARTPVGIYFLTEELHTPKIPFEQYGSLALTTDYPNIFDKREAKTGYGIWLHAVPDTVPLTRGSRGCVVVRDEIIKKLRNLVKLGQTPLLIYEDIEWLSPTEHNDQKIRYLADFEKWRKAWETEDVDTYMKFYDETFRNDQMNFKQWYRHKKKLKGLYSYIKVQLSPPLILQNKDQVVIRTQQRYESNLHRDFGEKTIHARWSPDVGFKIIREDWRPLPDPLAGQRPPAGEASTTSDNAGAAASTAAPNAAKN